MGEREGSVICKLPNLGPSRGICARPKVRGGRQDGRGRCLPLRLSL